MQVQVTTKARNKKLRKRLIMRRRKMLLAVMLKRKMILPRGMNQMRKIQEMMLSQREVEGHMSQRKVVVVVVVKVLADMVCLIDLNVVKKDQKDHQVEVVVLKGLVDMVCPIDLLVFRHLSPSLASCPSLSTTTK